MVQAAHQRHERGELCLLHDAELRRLVLPHLDRVITR